MKKWTYANESQNAYVRFLNLLSANRNQTSTYREVRTKIKREYWNKYPKWENLHRVLLLFSVKYVVIEMLKRRKNGFFCCLRPHGRSGLKCGSWREKISFSGLRPHGRSGLKFVIQKGWSQWNGLRPHGRSGLKCLVRGSFPGIGRVSARPFSKFAQCESESNINI